MATVAVPRTKSSDRSCAPPTRCSPAAALIVLTAISIYVRTRAISRLLLDGRGALGRDRLAPADRHPARPAPGRLAAALLPAAARLDGASPGASETAVHWLSLICSLLTIPAAMWAGWSLLGKRAGFLGAALCAVNPFLTAYGEETRMYSLMALLALLATACFLHVFVYRRRALPAGLRACCQTLMLYTHSWGIFYGDRRGARARADLVRAARTAARLLNDAAARLRRRRAAVPAVAADAALPGRAHGGAVGNKPRFGAPIQISRGAARRRPRDRRARCSPAASASPRCSREHGARRPRRACRSSVLLTIPVVTLAVAWIAVAGLARVDHALLRRGRSARCCC